MIAKVFEPLIQSLAWLGPVGLGATFVVPVILVAFLVRVLGLRIERRQWMGTALITPLQFLAIWYLISTTWDQAKHWRFAFQSLWPSSFAAAALASSLVIFMGVTRQISARWLAIVASFVFFTLMFGVVFQLAIYIFATLISWGLSGT